MKMLLPLRRVIAFCVFLAFLLLFAGWGGLLLEQTGFLARIQAGPAILAGAGLTLALLALATFLFGRLYCSLLCPLGLLQDGLLLARKKRPFSRMPELKWARAAILALYAISLVCGLMLPFALLDPYSTFGRIAADLFSPFLIWFQNGIAWAAQHLAGREIAASGLKFPGWTPFLLAVATFTLLVFLVCKFGRAWCNFCPVGTALGFLAAKSPFRIRLDSSRCIGCGKCERACKTGCIDLARGEVANSRCVTCFSCPNVCPRGAISYGAAMPEVATEPDSAKRTFLRLAISGLTLGALAAGESAAAEIDKLNRPDVVPARRKLRDRKLPLTPPGSGSLSHFAKHCIGCQLCVEACPNGILVASLTGPGLLQPGLSYEAGYCRPNCTACGDICPAGAIRPFTYEEKKSIQIGIAKTDFEKCIVHTDQVQCTACQRICPNQAISLIPIEGSRPDLKRPHVDGQKCTGCGACEYICPAMPLAAIAVEANRDHRKL